MINVKSWLITTLKNDVTLQGYLKDSAGNMNIFPMDVDLQPEQFPCITYADAGLALLANPPGMHVGYLQLDFWSIKSALEMETIYERVGVLLNYKDQFTQTSFSGVLWRFREESSQDMHTSTRRLWRKNVTYKVWANNTGNT